jgi:hypothetical protein
MLNIHRLSPTNMAGPGWDLVVYLVSVIVCVAIFANSLKRKTKLYDQYFFITLIGSFVTILLVCLEFTK